MVSKGRILLIYDKECPACDYYCHMVRIRESVGELVLVDARQAYDLSLSSYASAQLQAHSETAIQPVSTSREYASDESNTCAQESVAVINEVTRRGLDIDQGMVLAVAGQLYYGADAIHALALIGSRAGCLNRIHYWVFSSPRVSAVMYPILRTLRNGLLKVLRKTKINNLQQGSHQRF